MKDKTGECVVCGDVIHEDHEVLESSLGYSHRKCVKERI